MIVGVGIDRCTAVWWLAVMLAGLPGCQCSHKARSADVSEEVVARTVGSADRVAVGDIDGDGRVELVMVDADWVRVASLDGRELGRAPAPGGIQVLRVADLDGDGRAEVLAGWGRSRAHQDARARVTIYRLRRGELTEKLVAAPATSRNEVVEVLVRPGTSQPELLIAHFESKYMVRIAAAQVRDGAWTLSPIETIRMATSFAFGDVHGDGTADLVVGRVYGDDVDTDGDAFVLRPDGARVPIPVVGGVRALHTVDLDGDGRDEILIGDGWNKNYGRLARARLTRAWWDGERFRSELLEQDPAQFTLWSIDVVDLHGDRRPEIAVRGNAHARVLSREGGRWTGRIAASDCRDAAVMAADALLLVCKDGVRILR